MKKYRFKFENVLTLKKMAEEESLRNLALAQRKHQSEIDLKNFYLLESEKSSKRKEEISKNTVNVMELGIEQSYIEGNKVRIQAADQAIRKTNRQVNKATSDYFLAKKQRKMIDLLEEKDRHTFKEAVRKREVRMQEELTVMRYRLREEESS